MLAGSKSFLVRQHGETKVRQAEDEIEQSATASGRRRRREARSFSAAFHEAPYGVREVRTVAYATWLAMMVALAANTLWAVADDRLNPPPAWRSKSEEVLQNDALAAADVHMGVFLPRDELCVDFMSSVDAEGLNTTEVAEGAALLSAPESEDPASEAAMQVAAVAAHAPRAGVLDEGDLIMLHALHVTQRPLPAGTDLVWYDFAGWPEGMLPFNSTRWVWASKPFLLTVSHPFWERSTAGLMPIGVLRVAVVPYQERQLPRNDADTGLLKPLHLTLCRDIITDKTWVRQRNQRGQLKLDFEDAHGVFGTYTGSPDGFVGMRTLSLDKMARGSLHELHWYDVNAILISWGLLVSLAALVSLYFSRKLFNVCEAESTELFATMRMRLMQLQQFGAVRLPSGDNLLFVDHSQLPRLPCYDLRTTRTSADPMKHTHYIAPLPELSLADPARFGLVYQQNMENNGHSVQFDDKEHLRLTRVMDAQRMNLHREWQPVMLQSRLGVLAHLHGSSSPHSHALALEDALAGNIFLVKRFEGEAHRLALATLQTNPELIRAVIIIQKAFRAKAQILRLSGATKNTILSDKQLDDFRRSRVERANRYRQMYSGVGITPWAWHRASPMQLLLHICENTVTAILIQAFGARATNLEVKRRDLQLQTYINETLPKVYAAAKTATAGNTQLRRDLMDIVDNVLHWNIVDRVIMLVPQKMAALLRRTLRAMRSVELHFRLRLALLEYYSGLQAHLTVLDMLLRTYVHKLLKSSRGRRAVVLDHAMVQAYVVEEVHRFVDEQGVDWDPAERAFALGEITAVLREMAQKEAQKERQELAKDSKFRHYTMQIKKSLSFSLRSPRASSKVKPEAPSPATLVPHLGGCRQELLVSRMDAMRGALSDSGGVGGESALGVGAAAAGLASQLPEDVAQATGIADAASTVAASEAAVLGAASSAASTVQGEIQGTRDSVEACVEDIRDETKNQAEALVQRALDSGIGQAVKGAVAVVTVEGGVLDSARDMQAQVLSGEGTAAPEGTIAPPHTPFAEPSSQEDAGVLDVEDEEPACDPTLPHAETASESGIALAADDDAVEDEGKLGKLTDGEDSDGFGEDAVVAAAAGAHVDAEESSESEDDWPTPSDYTAHDTEEGEGPEDDREDGEDQSDEDSESGGDEDIAAGLTLAGASFLALRRLATDWHSSQILTVALACTVLMGGLFPLLLTGYLCAYALDSHLLAAIPCFVAVAALVSATVEFARANYEPIYTQEIDLKLRSANQNVRVLEDAYRAEQRKRVQQLEHRQLRSGSRMRSLQRHLTHNVSEVDVERMMRLGRGFKAFLVLHTYAKLRSGKFNEYFLKRAGLNAFKRWFDRRHERRKHRSYVLFRRIYLKRALFSMRHYARKSARLRQALDRAKISSRLRIWTLQLWAGVAAYAIFVYAGMALWLIVAALANVGEGGILSAVFLSGGVLAGRWYMKRNEKKAAEVAAMRKRLDERLDAAKKDKFSLIAGSKQAKKAAMMALVPSKWIDSQLSRMRKLLGKLMLAVAQRWKAMMNDSDLAYIYSDSLMDNLRCHLNMFHAAISDARLEAMLVRVRRTLLDGTRLAENDEAWDAQGWDLMVGQKSGLKAKLTVDALVEAIRKAAEASRAKLLALQAKENTARFFSDDDKKNELVKRAEKKIARKDSSVLMFLARLVGFLMCMAFVLLSFDAFAPDGTGSMVVAAVSTIILMLLFLSVGMGGAGAMGDVGVDAGGDAVDGEMEQDMEEDGNEEADEAEEEDEDEDEKDKSGKGKGSEEDSASSIGALHSKMDMLMNATVIFAKKAQVPLDDLGFDPDTLEDIEQRLDAAGEGDGALAKADEEMTDKAAKTTKADAGESVSAGKVAADNVASGVAGGAASAAAIVKASEVADASKLSLRHSATSQGGAGARPRQTAKGRAEAAKRAKGEPPIAKILEAKSSSGSRVASLNSIALPEVRIIVIIIDAPLLAAAHVMLATDAHLSRTTQPTAH